MPNPLDAAILKAPKSLLGTIVATTTKNNHDTATPFCNTTGNTLAGKLLLLQPDAACYINFGSANNITATTSNGIYVGAFERLEVLLDLNSSDAAYGYLACLSVSGTTNLKVWELAQR